MATSYGGMKAEEAKRLKELETEKRFKKLLAEAELDKAILKEGPSRETTDGRSTSSVLHYRRSSAEGEDRWRH
jgi:hypothetical protein